MLTRPRSELIQSTRRCQQVERIDMAQHRDHQILFERGRYRDVNVLVYLECRVGPSAVGFGDDADCSHGSLEEIGCERKRDSFVRTLLTVFGAVAQNGR